MEWYPYMTMETYLILFVMGMKFMSFYTFYPMVSIYSVVALLCHVYYTIDRKIIGKLRVCAQYVGWHQEAIFSVTESL